MFRPFFMKKTLPHLLLILVCTITLIAFCAHNIHHKSVGRQIFYAMPESAHYFTLGYDDVIADGAWVRVLQDIGLCEQHHHVTVRIGKHRVASCKDGWVYHMLDLVMTLAPRWRLPQRVGPMALSVMVDDRNGATKLFDKAVKNFPNDWPILTRAGYHYLYEEQDYLKAAKVYEAAGKQPGAPEWCKYLAGKLFEETGRLQVAKIVLEDFLKRPDTSAIGLHKARERLAQINKRLAELEAKHESEGPLTKNPAAPQDDRMK